MTATEFNEADIRKFPQTTRRVIALARLLEWSLKWRGTQKNTLVLTSPGHQKDLTIPLTNVSPNRLRTWTHALIRYTDQDLVERVLLGDIDMLRDPEMAALITTMGTGMAVKARELIDQDKEQQRETAMETAMREAAEKLQEVPAPPVKRPAQELPNRNGTDWWVEVGENGDPLFTCRAHPKWFTTQTQLGKAEHDSSHNPASTADEWFRKGPVARKIVSRRDYPGARGVVSKDVEEREHGDGRITWKCKHCKFTSTVSARSVSNHAKAAHIKRKTYAGQPVKSHAKRKHDDAQDGVAAHMVVVPPSIDTPKETNVAASAEDRLAHIRAIVAPDMEDTMNTLVRQRDEAIRRAEAAESKIANYKAAAQLFSEVD